MQRSAQPPSRRPSTPRARRSARVVASGRSRWGACGPPAIVSTWPGPTAAARAGIALSGTSPPAAGSPRTSHARRPSSRPRSGRRSRGSPASGGPRARTRRGRERCRGNGDDPSSGRLVRAPAGRSRGCDGPRPRAPARPATRCPTTRRRRGRGGPVDRRSGPRMRRRTGCPRLRRRSAPARRGLRARRRRREEGRPRSPGSGPGVHRSSGPRSWRHDGRCTPPP